MRLKLALLAVFIAAMVGILYAQGSATGPLTDKEVLQGLKSKTAPEVLIETVNQRGVDFELTPELEKKFRKAKATDQVIEAIRKGSPSERAKRQAQGQPATQGPPITPEEGQAFSALRNELDPDKAIAMANDFAQKYPNSSLLSYAYWFAANGYQQKNDAAKIAEYCELSLKLKPDNLMSLMLISTVLPTPQYLNKHEADKEKTLQGAETYANRALQLIEQVPKQANETDEQYQKRKASYASGAHASLGMIHLERSSLSLAGPDKDELAKAEKEYQMAVSTTDRPEPGDYYRLGEAYSIDGKLDEALSAFTKASEMSQGSMLKTFADQRIDELKKRKAQGPSSPQP